MSYLPLIIAIVSGVVGGNVLGAAVKNLNLGPVGNSIAGLLGGGIGGQLLVGTVLESIGGGVAGGGVLTAASAGIKQLLAKPT